MEYTSLSPYLEKKFPSVRIVWDLESNSMKSAFFSNSSLWSMDFSNGDFEKAPMSREISPKKGKQIKFLSEFKATKEFISRGWAFTSSIEEFF